MKKTIRFAVGLLAVILIISIVYISFGNKSTTVYNGETLKTEKITALEKIPQDFVLITEDSKSQLFIGSQGTGPIVKVVDKSSGLEWLSGVSQDYYGKKVNKVQNVLLTSILSISYTDFEQKSGMVMAGADGTTVTYKKASNGATFLFDFNDQEIQVTMNIKLDKGAMVVDVPFDGIRENSKFALVSMELFPSFDAARIDENGYIFVPDGSGAIYNFLGRLQDTTLRVWNIYGTDEIDLDKIEANRRNGIYDASIPVFGMKKGNRAFAGIVTNGAEETEIKFAPAGYKLDLYRIHTNMRYRKRYTIKTADDKEITSVNKQIIMNDFEIRYEFLSNDQADYSGMACAYREYLIESGQLAATIRKDDKISVGIDFLTGISEDRLLMNRFIDMTTFKSVENTLRRLKENDVDNVHTILYGWQKSGYGRHPNHYPLSGELGGEKDMKSLLGFVEDTGYKLYLNDNYVDAYKESGGFNLRNDVIYRELDMVATNKKKNRFLFNPIKTNQLLNDFIQGKLDRFKISGLAFDKLGVMVYSDNSITQPVSRSATVDTWEKMMKTSKDVFGGVAVEGANAYTYKIAERLYNVPEKSSRYFKFEQDVPFIQIVLHGSVLYSSSPGNLSYDIEETKLRWVEFGSMPVFLLTDKDASELKHTEMNILFASDLNQWTDYAIRIYKEMNDRLKPVINSKILKHERLDNDVVKVTYDTNYIVYINYSDSDRMIHGTGVKARDYMVVEMEGEGI